MVLGRATEDYHLDLLGAWDYAVEDPDGVLGGKYPEDQAPCDGYVDVSDNWVVYIIINHNR